MATRLTAAMARVSASVIADRARWASTNTIIASEPALMPSSSAAVRGDRRMRWTSGRVSATNTNAGRKMPTVAATDPTGPPSRKPMNVAVVNTGPA